MANIKVSALTALPASNATFTYGITNSNTEGKVAVGGAGDGLATLISPALTGNPTAPTQTAGNSSTRLATTAFVATSFSPLASPTFTGTPAAPTAAAGTNTTQLATTAYADRFNGDPQFFAPTTGQTISPTATGSNIGCFVNPIGTLLALTLTLPTGTIKGQTLYATFTQIITGLTVTAANVDTKGKAAPSSAAVGDTFGWRWDSVSTKWNRFV